MPCRGLLFDDYISFYLLGAVCSRAGWLYPIVAFSGKKQKKICDLDNESCEGDARTSELFYPL